MLRTSSQVIQWQEAAQGRGGERLWPHYAAVSRPERIVRTACRYINNLNLPMRHGQDFADFLTTPPQVPSELPQNVLEFVQRVMIPYPELNTITMLTQLLERSAVPRTDKIPVILDVDVQCRQDFDPQGSQMWECLERLRKLKNDAFFESITETTAGLYE